MYLLQASVSLPLPSVSTSPNPPPPSHSFHPPIDSKLVKCLIVGLPCGQFHGLSILPICSNTSFICLFDSVFPIIILLRHARMANIFRTFVGLGTLTESGPRLGHSASM